MKDNYTNTIGERLRRLKEQQGKQMTIEVQKNTMWMGMAAFLSLSVLSEHEEGLTSAQVASRLMRSQVYEKTNNVNKWLMNMAESGIVIAHWDGDPMIKTSTKRRYKLTPAGWVFLFETEKIWSDMVQKVFSVTRKKVFVTIKK